MKISEIISEKSIVKEKIGDKKKKERKKSKKFENKIAKNYIFDNPNFSQIIHIKARLYIQKITIIGQGVPEMHDFD